MDILSLIIAVISLLFSSYTAFKTNQIANNEIRLSRRTELHSLMHTIEQVLIDKPELALIFKSEADHKGKYTEPSVAVQEAYVFMHFNLFELAYSLFKETSELSKNEQEIQEAWNCTIENFFDNCIPSTSLWNEHKSTYYKSFRNHIDFILQKSS